MHAITLKQDPHAASSRHRYVSCNSFNKPSILWQPSARRAFYMKHSSAACGRLGADAVDHMRGGLHCCRRLLRLGPAARLCPLQHGKQPLPRVGQMHS